MLEKPSLSENSAPLVEVSDSWSDRIEQSLTGNRYAIQSVFNGRKDAIKAAESLRLEDGFAEALKDLRESHLVRPCELIPDFEQVLQVFTPETLVATQDFQDPEFIMGSGRSFYDMVAAANRDKKMLLQRNAHMDEIFIDSAEREPQNWSAYVVEGAPKIETREFNNIYLPLGDRVKRFAEHKKSSGIKGMDRWMYLALMMKKLKKGQPVDAEFYTILDQDPALTLVHIPYAFWNGKVPWNRRVVFDWQNPEECEQNFRFRRSVGGEIQM